MPMNRSEVVVVTGASAGVGRAAVRAFAREGACFGLIGRGWEGLAGAANEWGAVGGWGLVSTCAVVSGGVKGCVVTEV